MTGERRENVAFAATGACAGFFAAVAVLVLIYALLSLVQLLPSLSAPPTPGF